MSLNMLKHNIELLIEVSQNYQILLNKKAIVSTVTEQKKIKEELINFKNYITYLTASIQKLIEEEKNGI